MDEGVELYTKRVIQAYSDQVEYINTRYPRHCDGDLRKMWIDEHKYITIGKLECLHDQNLVARELVDKLIRVVNEVT